ncbi:hypothetical protein LOTGIDRAFT_166048 [Lottia gigantea]|uniref:Voltage-gated hydrogen channel 1 n=1 Tax=Lottia gigantea TaxID=225164 RepID=V3ZAM5_LOTGI|nr:hypothetical protein LOTGIDRAFT_166048 [Lottia gigantea]ESO88028.1 hypothetical protein LOTGIDRAFT_166048 [Lottia gigantea]
MKIMSLAPERKIYASLSCDVLHPPRDNSTELLLGLLAAQTVKIASINGGIQEINDIENELEKEIQWENRAKHDALDRIRHRGEHILHAKFCLLAIVILNVVDCILVIGALLVEFHHMQNLIEMKDGNAGKFLEKMQAKYPDVTSLSGMTSKKIFKMYESILVSDIGWINGSMYYSHACEPQVDFSCSPSVNYTKDFVQTLFFEHGGKTHYIEEKISHIFHYLSITILAILLIETMIKIFCTVPRFFKQKLQVFDAFVVLVSFILDLVFIDGFLGLDVGEFVLAVTFILPWRIIRILNSLVVAVMEKERYNLKIIYKQKKKVEKTNTENVAKVVELEKQVTLLKKICDDHNVPAWEVNTIVGVPEKTSALGKLAFRAAGSLTPAPMTTSTGGTSTPNVFLAAFQNGFDKKKANGQVSSNGHVVSESVSTPNISESVPNDVKDTSSNSTDKIGSVKSAPVIKPVDDTPSDATTNNENGDVEKVRDGDHVTKF